MGRRFVIRICVAIVFIKPWRGDSIGDCFDDVLMERPKHKRRYSFLTEFREFLTIFNPDSERARTYCDEDAGAPDYKNVEV